MLCWAPSAFNMFDAHRSQLPSPFTQLFESKLLRTAPETVPLNHLHTYSIKAYGSKHLTNRPTSVLPVPTNTHHYSVPSARHSQPPKHPSHVQHSDPTWYIPLRSSRSLSPAVGRRAERTIVALRADFDDAFGRRDVLGGNCVGTTFTFQGK